MCGIVEHTSNMATILKEKEKQMKLAQVTNRLEKVTKVVKHLAQTTKISPQATKATEQNSTWQQ